MGYEIENVRSGEYDTNVAECNTGGFLIYDLSNITQYGDGAVMLNNKAWNNNTYNFAESGGLISMVTRGVGFTTVGYDLMLMYDIHFEKHATTTIFYIYLVLMNVCGGT